MQIKDYQISSLTRTSRLLLWAALPIALMTSATALGADNAMREMTFVAFGGTTQKAMTEVFVDPFMKESNIRVHQAQPTNYAKIKAMVSAGRTSWDVVDGESPIVARQCGKLFEKLDFNKLDVSNIPDDLMETDCGVPSYRTGIVLLYNADAYKGKSAPSSWDDFFDTERYPGKRAIGADPLYVLGPVMRAITGSNEQAYPIDYDAVFDKLDTIKDSLITWKTGAQAVQIMQSGRANMILTWPGRGAEAVNQGANYKPVWAASEFSYDVWAIPKGSKHVAAAEKFINYALKAEPQTQFAKITAYAPTNKSSETPDASTTSGDFAMTFDKQDQYNVLLRDQNWWAKNWDEAHDKFSAWSFR